MSVALFAMSPASPSTIPDTAAAPAKMVITVRPVPANEPLQTGDLTVVRRSAVLPVMRLERLAGDLADMQLFVLLDDSTRSSSLGIQIPELKTFLDSLPITTQVAVGYMRNGTFVLSQAFTTDHHKAAGSLRLPQSMPGENGSPYFALSDLVRHWPSKQPTGRRAVLMLTDGVDRYWGTAVMEDPYVDYAIRDALKNGVMVYSIYLRGAGEYGRRGWSLTTAQSRLIQVSEGTGGCAYFEGVSDPVTISPFLNDFRDRLDNQYEITVQTPLEKGMQSVKVRSLRPGLKIDAPAYLYVR